MTTDPAHHRGLVAQWTNVWVTLLEERRSAAARTAVAGAYCGVIAGASSAPALFVLNEMFGRPSSTSVLGLFVLPIYMPAFGIAAALAFGVLTAFAASIPGFGIRAARVRGVTAIKWAGATGLVIGVAAAAAAIWDEQRSAKTPVVQWHVGSMTLPAPFTIRSRSPALIAGRRCRPTRQPHPPRGRGSVR